MFLHKPFTMTPALLEANRQSPEINGPRTTRGNEKKIVYIFASKA
jgi:hypothetical protein